MALANTSKSDARLRNSHAPAGLTSQGGYLVGLSGVALSPLLPAYEMHNNALLKAACAHIRSREPNRQQYYMIACVTLMQPHPVHRLVPASKVAPTLRSAKSEPAINYLEEHMSDAYRMILGLNLGATLPPRSTHASEALRLR